MKDWKFIEPKVIPEIRLCFLCKTATGYLICKHCNEILCLNCWQNYNFDRRCCKFKDKSQLNKNIEDKEFGDFEWKR